MSDKMGEHNWVLHLISGLMVCKLCGIVMRLDKNNKPCKGKVKVELRESPNE